MPNKTADTRTRRARDKRLRQPLPVSVTIQTRHAGKYTMRREHPVHHNGLQKTSS